MKTNKELLEEILSIVENDDLTDEDTVNVIYHFCKEKLAEIDQ